MISNNYLMVTLFIFFTGSVFTPTRGMDVQQENIEHQKQEYEQQFERAKQLIDVFCLITEQKTIYSKRIYGFQIYNRLKKNFSDMLINNAHKKAIEKLQIEYKQSMVGFNYSILFGADNCKENAKEILDILVNYEKIEIDVAKHALRNRIMNAEFNDSNLYNPILHNIGLYDLKEIQELEKYEKEQRKAERNNNDE